MYSLTFNNDLIYDPRAADDMLVIYESDVQLAVGAAGSMTFTIPPTHPLLDKLTVLKGTLDLKQDGKSIFRGRILHKKPVMGGEVEIISEGVLAYLNDSIVEPYVFPDDFLEDPGYKAAASGGNVVEWWLGWLLNNHNSQVGAEKQIQLGKVTVRDPNNYVKRSCEDFTHTLKVINEKLPGSSLGGYLMIRYGDDGKNYLDYISEFTETNEQLVAYGENLLDLNRDISGESVITAILPIGADGLTISGLPDGNLPNGLKKAGKVIYDPAAEERYGGRIVEPVTWDDVTINTNLQTKAAAYLLKAVALPENITVKACDLHGVDEDIPSFTLGQYAIVHNPRDVEDKAMYPVMELQPDIHDPGNTVLTLGRTTTTLSKSTYTDNRSTADSIEVHTSAAVKQASEEMNALLAQASGLYCTPQVQPDGSTIYYLHDKKTMGESRLVMKLTAEAIGFSTDGGSTYPYGFTVSGEMVMKTIAAEGINADWIDTGTLNLGVLKLLGTICGIMQGYGMTASGRTTQGIVLFGNGASGNDADPPYFIVTNAGMRGQASKDYSWNMSNQWFEILGSLALRKVNGSYGSITTEGNIIADGELYSYTNVRCAGYMACSGDMTAGGAVKGASLSVTGGASIGYGKSDPIQIGHYGSNLAECYWRSMTDADGNSYMVLTQA